MSNVLLSQALMNRQMTLIVPVGIFSVHPFPPNERVLKKKKNRNEADETNH